MFDFRLMKISPDSKKYIIYNVLLQWFDLCVNAFIIYEIAYIINALYTNSIESNNLVIIIITVLIAISIRYFLIKYASRMGYYASKSIKKILRDKIYTKLLSLGTIYRDYVSTAELVQESVEGVDQLESYFGLYVPQFFYAFLAPITLAILFTLFGGFKVALVLLICVPLIPGSIVMVQKIAKKILAKYWDQYTKLGSTFLENLQGMTTLKVYKADEYKNIQMNKESEHFRVITMKVLTMQLNSIIIMDIFAYGGAGLGIIIALLLFQKNQISLIAVIFMVLLSAEFFLPMRRLGSYFHVAMNGLAASDKIFKFLDITTDDCLNEKVDIDDIRFKNVSFSYDEKRSVLDNVNIDINRGSFVGVVGESGSGKSTIASLLMARHKASSGQILINGKNINDLDKKELLKMITYISNESSLYKGTVKDNLLMGKNVSDEKLWEVLKECSLKEDFEKLDGLNTKLLEDASNLSGGQRQRLILARAIIHDSSVYIFDEATSNVDIESEEIILAKIMQMRKNKTIIMISHRLSTVKDADIIYVLKDGKLVEKGKHLELMNNKGEYERLFKTQEELENYGVDNE